MSNSLRILSLKIDNFLLEMSDRLNIFFSEDLSSWNVNWNASYNILIVDNSFSHFLFSVYWPLNFSLSDDRSLDDLLFDDWLRNDSSSNDRLRNDFSINLRS